MAINKNSDNSLSVNDILRQVGITPGTTIDFASLGTLLGAGNSNHILPDSFVGKNLSLSAGSISVSPSGTLAFAIAGETKTITVSADGVFIITDIPSWLSVSPIAATGNTAVTLYASSNSSLGTNARSATLNFLGASNVSRAEKATSQNGNPVTSTISADTTISSGTTTRNIVLTLSNQLSVVSVSLTNTTGFSINTTPTISAGATTTTYTYVLTITAASSGNSKESTAEFFVGGSGYSSTLRSKTTQAALSEYLVSNITITEFDVNSSGTIAVPNLSPSGGTIVYSTATNGGGTTYTSAQGFPLVDTNTTRYATYTITVPAGYSNSGSSLSKSAAAPQELATSFTSANISITGFDVNELGVISVPNLSPSGGTIVYSTATFGQGTTYTSAQGFPLVSVDTNRYCTVTVTAPAGYYNAGSSVSRSVSAPQEERFYGSDKISIGEWGVSEFGEIASPIVSAIGVTDANITVTYSGAIVSKGYPQSLSNIDRTTTATVTVPAGWFNSGGTQSASRTTTQPATELTGWLYYPYNITNQRENWNIPLWNVYRPDGTYTGTGFWGATETDEKYLTFSLRTNVEVVYRVTQWNTGNWTIVDGQTSNDTPLVDNEFTTKLETTAAIGNQYIDFKLKVSAPAAGSSTYTTLDFVTNDASKNFKIYLELTRTSTGGTVASPTVDTGTVKQFQYVL